MLDEKRLKLMTQLAFYEEVDGKQDFKVSGYYRKDFVGMHGICSFLWVTLGYACILGLVGMAGMEMFLGKMSNGLIFTLAISVFVGYFFLLILYGVISNHIYNAKHKRARQNVKRYNHDLIKLLKMYEKEKR